MNLQLSVWGLRQNFLALRDGIVAEVLRTFGDERIEIPFPQRTLHAGAGTVHVVSAEPKGPSPKGA